MAQDRYLLDRARHLRNDGTPFEALLWKRLSRSQLGGFKSRRQHVIGNTIVDFFFPQKGLVVEVDGNTHQRARDAVRDQIHAHKGYATVRFTNAEVGRNIEQVLLRIFAKLGDLPDRWPHPNPSPEGEGNS